MGRKRALLVGINYSDDPENKLRGCWNDVERMGECLVSRYGFSKEAICTLVDRPGTSPRLMPTGEVIREKLGDLTRDLQWGDCILFHFSGHGVQLPPEGEPDETGMKEAIVPADFNLITDDDFRVLVDKIPDGVAFTFIADCCHSGGLIAHSEQQVGSVHTKPVSLLSSLGPQPQEDESEEEEGEPVVVSEEVMIEILASMLGSVSTQDPSVSLLEILAMMEAANSANQDLSLLDLLALYVASQQHNVSMSDILESMLAEQESAPGQQNATQKAFATSSRSLQRDKQLRKDSIQHMLGSTKAHNVQRLLRSGHARRSLSSRVFNGAPYNASYGGYQHDALQDQNRSGFSHDNSGSILLHQRYAYPPPDVAGNLHNDANAPWQCPPPLKHAVSDPGAYAFSHSHAGAPDPREPNPFGAHPSMQRWGSDLGGGSGYGMAGHGRYSGGAMQGGVAQFQTPWAAKPVVDTAPGSRHNHEAGFRGDFHGRQESLQLGAWSHGGPQPICGGRKYAKKRSMPVHAVTRELSERAGRKVEAGNIRANLYDLFGDKSSITCKAVVATILDGLTNKGGCSSARGILKRISSKSIDFLSSKLHDPKTKIDKYLRSTTSASGVSPTTLHHIPKRPDRCVLITACQSDEVASEHMEVTHGAFTKVILDIVEEHKASLLDNHRLVYESRHRLAKKPYRQHPCLYSTTQQAHNVFISY